TDWLNPKGKPVKHLTPRYEPKKGNPSLRKVA
ncbi:hypothetical protein CCACVL1_00818, partial [Corchorus capsularis]